MRFTLSKEVWIGWVSSSVEAYNMAIYCFTAPKLAGLLFSEQSHESALFFSYGLVFVAAALIYPAGALYYGYIGDKKGRQKTCVYSTLGLALTTGLMGLIPFSAISWLSFLLLICGQHFFSGGEYYGSIVFSLEHAGEREGGLMSALSCLFAVFGLVAASGLATLAEGPWELKACFMIGAAGGIISYLLKNYCLETPAFRALMGGPLMAGHFFRAEWRRLMQAILVFAFFIVSYTYIFIFLPLTAPSTDFGTFQSLILYGVLLVASGFVADRFGIERVMKAGVSLFALAILPLSLLGNMLVMQMVLTAFACLVIGPIHSWMLHQFPVRSRCRGIFIGSGIATALFGGQHCAALPPAL